MKRRDLLVGFMSGVGFTAGNAYLWQMAQNGAKSRDLWSESGYYMMDDDPFAIGEREKQEVAALLRPEPGSETSALRAKVADATELPSLDELAEELAGQPPVVPAPQLAQNVPASEPAAKPGEVLPEEPVGGDQRQLLLEKVRNFNGDFIDDIFLPEAERPTLHSLHLRFQRAERLVGHGNYNLLAFDELFKYGKRYPQIGEFTLAELDMIEKLFFTEAEKYGFYGEKVTKELTAKIPEQEAVKVPYSGHFLLRGDSSAYYDKLRKDIGDTVILTSGIRGNVKQMHLFVAKCLEAHYNLSKASRSLAPPGHSYHGVGDFDVGRVGWGYSNFTDKFAETDEFKRMQDLGYVQIRYTKDNHYGVRFEPWHIKVV
ncbi:M15 family metallopeptidase [Marinimicrobium agarilyticum]|uniref:M15 family metallopeptidase n=1 Tax=Marinimicrobium agarilyticum TaxID=306546 RepID=UPI0004038551|nr:M15 family metallopeptidase [Marinimicrobium agarilyticum]